MIINFISDECIRRSMVDDPDAPIVPIAPEASREPTDEVEPRSDGGSTTRYDTAEWGAPLVPEQ